MLSQLEQFRIDFINSYNQNTHKSRGMNNSAAKAANALCVSQEIKNILIEETHAMHKQGQKLICNRHFKRYNHINLINAACKQANMQTYSQLYNTLHGKESRIKQLQQQLNNQSQQYHQTHQQQQQITTQYLQQINQLQTQLQSLNATKDKYQQQRDNLQQQLELSNQEKVEVSSLQKILNTNYSDFVQLQSLNKQQASVIDNQVSGIQRLQNKIEQLIKKKQELQLQFSEQIKAQQQRFVEQKKKLELSMNNKLNARQKLCDKRFHDLEQKLVGLEKENKKLALLNEKLALLNEKYSKDMFEMLNNKNKNDKKSSKKRKRSSLRDNIDNINENESSNNDISKNSSKSNHNGNNNNSSNIDNGNDGEPQRKKRKIQTNWKHKNILAGIKFILNKKLCVVDKVTQANIIYYNHDHYNKDIKEKNRKISHHDKNAMFVGDVIATKDGTNLKVVKINISDNESDGTIDCKNTNNGNVFSKINIADVTVFDTKNRKVGITSRVNRSIESSTGLNCTIYNLIFVLHTVMMLI